MQIPRIPPPSPDEERRQIYADVLALARRAERANLPTVAYLLDMAAHFAKDDGGTAWP
jgi:hypothetical protein